MSKKCLYTLLFFCVFTALASVFMRLFLLFPFNEWVGLGTGLALFLAAGALWIAVKKNRAVPYIVCAVNAAASGIGLSSFYVWLGSIPAVWQIAAVWGAYSVFFSCFCLLTNVRFVRDYSAPCTLAFLLLPLAGGVVGVCLSSVAVFSFALFLMIPFAAFLIVLSAKAKNLRAQVKHTAYASYGALLALLITVFFIIGDSSGSSNGGGTGERGNGFFSRNGYNPYDFYKG